MINPSDMTKMMDLENFHNLVNQPLYLVSNATLVFVFLSLSVIVEYIIASVIIYGVLQLHFDIRLLNTRNLDGFASNVNDLEGTPSGADDATSEAKARTKNKMLRTTSNGGGGVCGRAVMDILCEYDCFDVISGGILNILMVLMLIKMMLYHLNVISNKFCDPMLSFFV